jgi:hypothetical protein
MTVTILLLAIVLGVVVCGVRRCRKHSIETKVLSELRLDSSHTVASLACATKSGHEKVEALLEIFDQRELIRNPVDGHYCLTLKGEQECRRRKL